MPRTTLCKNCGIILNLPDRVGAGKRLRCPKCGVRFVVTVEDASSESTLPGPADADSLSHFDMDSRPPAPDELPLPVAEKDLRETFDLPLMSARDAERSGAATEPAIADAASLLHDRPSPRRPTSAADARAKARRCSHCGGLVPQGMSICVSCGVDQETGMRVGLEDDLAPPPPPPPSGPPLHVAIVGGLCATAGLILLILALVRSLGGAQGWQSYGWLGLALSSAFAIFASVQFIRGKSVKLMMMALTLGLVLNLMALIAMPLIQPMLQDSDQIVQPIQSDDPDVSDIQIEPLEKRIDVGKIELGIGFIVVYAILSWYLMSPPVKRFFHLHVRAEKAIW